jgi:hypothetical protein
MHSDKNIKVRVCQLIDIAIMYTSEDGVSMAQILSFSPRVLIQYFGFGTSIHEF